MFAGVGAGTAVGENAGPTKAGHTYTDGRYIVTFGDDPVASYEGYERGFPATRPQPGGKLDANSPAARNWQQHLVAKHDAALGSVGATKIYDYTVTNNGVAVNLTAGQAARLANTAGVMALHKDELVQPSTTATPEFLGLTAANGLWAQLGGARNAGAGVVVGVIDTGIWPESRSFAGGTGIPVPADWRGTCVDGEQFNRQTCNDKLIGGRYYVAGFGTQNVATDDYLSPRDGDGHGSHTASTAAGNLVSDVAIDGVRFEDGTAAGMAPGAKVAAYKVCWEGKPGVDPGCFNSDSVAAINDAVADGVDVLNYSIGGSSESDVLDPVEQAFRAASNAGVYSANSAGNSGPGASTFDHPSPWVTTVAASTVRRAFLAVELGNGQRYVGASTTPPLPTATQFVTSLSVKLASATDANARLCAPGTLDPTKAVGKVVQCDRGVVDRIAKSFEVRRAGGVGMVMTNTSLNSLNGDYHPIPSTHVSHEARQPILDYIAAAGVGATANTHSPPPAAYGREKAYVERVLDAVELRYPEVRVVRMRPGFVFQFAAGTSQRRIFAGPFVPNLVARPGRLPFLPVPSGLRFQALHTHDVADAYRRAVVNGIDVLCHTGTWGGLWGHANAERAVFFEPAADLIDQAVRSKVGRIVQASTVVIAGVPRNGQPVDDDAVGAHTGFWPHLDRLIDLDRYMRADSHRGTQMVTMRLDHFVGAGNRLGIVPALVPRLRNTPGAVAGRRPRPPAAGRGHRPRRGIRAGRHRRRLGRLRVVQHLRPGLPYCPRGHRLRGGPSRCAAPSLQRPVPDRPEVPPGP